MYKDLRTTSGVKRLIVPLLILSALLSLGCLENVDEMLDPDLTIIVEETCDQSQGRFCNPLSLSDTPAISHCVPVFSNSDTAGLCVDLCSIPDATGTRQQLDCPGSYQCVIDARSPYIVPALDASGQVVECAIDDDCTIFGERCNDPFPPYNHKLCVYHYGVCDI